LQEHGAIYGIGEGLQGRSYGIPTKDEKLRSLPIDSIKLGIDRFILFAECNPGLSFDVTPVGCGLAGYKRSEIKPLFRLMPNNCYFTKEWDEP